MTSCLSVELGDVVEFLNGGAWGQSEYSDDGLPVVRVSDISGGGICLDNCKYIPSESLPRYRRHILHRDDLVIATVGSHPNQPASVVGRTCRVSGKAVGALLNQNAVCLRPSSESIEKRYLYYLGASSDFRNFIISHARGTASQVRIAIGELRRMVVHLPPMESQRRIASILSAYDDLIENNTRRIRILDEMARSIYREWFVHFRFPGHEYVKMVESELGLIPEGWEVKKLGELAADVRRAVNPDQINPETPYFGLEHLPRRSIALSDWGTAKEVQSTKLAFKEGDILFGKIRPYFHKVGIAPVSGVCSSDTIVIVPKQPEHFGLVLGCVSSDAFVAHATQTSQGTKMPRANWNVLVNYGMAVPPAPVLFKFNECMQPMLSLILALVMKNRNLRQTRDLLVPKLVSGEVDVSGLDTAIPYEAA